MTVCEQVGGVTCKWRTTDGQFGHREGSTEHGAGILPQTTDWRDKKFILPQITCDYSLSFCWIVNPCVLQLAALPCRLLPARTGQCFSICPDIPIVTVLAYFRVEGGLMYCVTILGCRTMWLVNTEGGCCSRILALRHGDILIFVEVQSSLSLSACGRTILCLLQSTN